MEMSFTSRMTHRLSVRVNMKNHKIFKWLFGTVWSPSGGGLGGRNKAPVAMAVWREQRCILALEPNATLIFSLATLQLSLHSLFVSQSSLLLSVTLQFPPTPHANLKSAAFCKEKKRTKTDRHTHTHTHTVPETGQSAPSDHEETLGWQVRRDNKQIGHDFHCDSSNGFVNSTTHTHFRCKTPAARLNCSPITPPMYATSPAIYNSKTVLLPPPKATHCCISINCLWNNEIATSFHFHSTKCHKTRGIYMDCGVTLTFEAGAF